MTASNGTMMQYFHWYVPNDGSLWKQVKDEAGEWAARTRLIRNDPKIAYLPGSRRPI